MEFKEFAKVNFTKEPLFIHSSAITRHNNTPSLYLLDIFYGEYDYRDAFECLDMKNIPFQLFNRA